MIHFNTIVNEMVLKPSDQIDYNARTVTVTSKTTDIKFIKENPVLKPEVVKDIIYTVVGVLYGNKSFKRYLAHYFSTLSKTGQSVSDCILNTKKRPQLVQMLS